jgi:hypothetical protein
VSFCINVPNFKRLRLSVLKTRTNDAQQSHGVEPAVWTVGRREGREERQFFFRRPIVLKFGTTTAGVLLHVPTKFQDDSSSKAISVAVA